MDDGGAMGGDGALAISSFAIAINGGGGDNGRRRNNGRRDGGPMKGDGDGGTLPGRWHDCDGRRRRRCHRAAEKLMKTLPLRGWASLALGLLCSAGDPVAEDQRDASGPEVEDKVDADGPKADGERKPRPLQRACTQT